MMVDVSEDPVAKDFMQDVVPYVEQHYRVVADAGSPRACRLIDGRDSNPQHRPHQPGLLLLHRSFLLQLRLVRRIPLSQFEQKHADALRNPDKKVVKLFWLGREIRYRDAQYATCYRHGHEVWLHRWKTSHPSEGFHAWNNWRDYLHEFAPRLFQ